MVVKINVKTIRGRKYFQARENGKLVAQRKVAGSGLKLRQAQKIFSINKTFFQDRTAKSITLKNFTQKFVFAKSSKKFTSSKNLKQIRPRHKAKFDELNNLVKGRGQQYVIEANIDGKRVQATSSLIGSNRARNLKEAKEQALEILYKRTAEAFGVGYDADEGKSVFMKAKKLRIREGFIYYTKRRKRG